MWYSEKALNPVVNLPFLSVAEMKVSIICAEITVKENLPLNTLFYLPVTQKTIILKSHLLEGKVYFFTENNPLNFLFVV